MATATEIINKPLMICHVEKPVNYTLYDCKWIPQSARFIVVGSQPRGTGMIEIFEVVHNDVASVKHVSTNRLNLSTFFKHCVKIQVKAQLLDLYY